MKTYHAEKTGTWNSGIFTAFSNQGLKHADGLCVCVFFFVYGKCVCSFLKKAVPQHKFQESLILLPGSVGELFCQTLPFGSRSA